MTDITPFANRLGKNIKHLMKWAKRNNIEAWRIYDRDIPQFPFAVDVYCDQIHLQEYDTGWLMQPEEYEAWLAEVLEAVAFVTGFAPEQIHLKRRERQKGLQQYEKTGKTGDDFVITENGRKFWVNLDKYLDTGLFLDHRNTRKKVGETAAGKCFLNLFSYTGSFTVYAATGGAVSSETVDLSNTYLEWAKRNFELNGIDTEQHKIVRADVFQYLQNASDEGKKFDLIVMDPPSFSNSKKMLDILDIQRDHKKLIDGAMSLLASDGILYFSNNLRSFVLDDLVLFGADAVELEIAFCPIEICVGQIDGFAGRCAAGGCIDGEAAGVGEQVEEAFARCGFADFFARVAVVEKEAGVEVFVKVDPKLAVVFGDDEIVAGFAGFFVLLQAFLAFAALEVDLFGRKTGNESDGFQDFGKPRFVFFGLHQPAGIVFLKVDLVAVNIDGKGELGDVAVVNAPGFDAVAFRPFHEVFNVFAHAVGEGSYVGHGFQTA